ncbi:MAG: hypothetical protein IT161_16435 [Bryobacterales bacterium]|nr:hypothetical protein [Bryobacterales bacterium]
MRQRSKLAAGICVVILLGAAGCGKSQSETGKKLAELQAQIEEQKKELEQAKAASEQPQPAQPGTAARSSNQVSAKAGDSDANKSAIASNKDAIAANKGNIENNAANIEKNRQGVEEARKMAAAPPYHTIPAGTVISVRTLGPISTKTAATGSLFEATLVGPLSIGNYLVADAGSAVEGVVTNADPGGRVKGVATISVALRGIMMADGRRLPVRTAAKTFEAKKSKGKDAAKIGIGAGIGAAIGAIAGGGKGAAIGAAAGGGGGTALALGTRGDPAVIPAETVLNLALSSEVRVQELKQ